MNVFLLWHISHAERQDDSHRDRWGDLWYEPEFGDVVMLLGCYSTRELAEARIAQSLDVPGFRDEPSCFDIAEMTVDRDGWPEGFVTVVESDELGDDRFPITLVRADGARLRAALLAWDPIGVSGESGDSEYDCLIGPLLKRLNRDESEDQILGWLMAEMESHFGLTVDEALAREFVRGIRPR